MSAERVCICPPRQRVVDGGRCWRCGGIPTAEELRRLVYGDCTHLREHPPVPSDYEMPVGLVIFVVVVCAFLLAGLTYAAVTLAQAVL